MSNKPVCPSCGSGKVIPTARIYAQYYMTVSVPLGRAARLMKKNEHSPTQAVVCGECGLIQMHAERPDKLWRAYLRSRADTSS